MFIKYKFSCSCTRFFFLIHYDYYAKAAISVKIVETLLQIGYFLREICSSPKRKNSFFVNSHHPPTCTAHSMLKQAWWIILYGYSIGKGIGGVTYQEQRQDKLHLESERLVPDTAATLICSFKSSIENCVVPWSKVNILDLCSWIVIIPLQQQTQFWQHLKFLVLFHLQG